jgi:hypothetical protein
MENQHRKISGYRDLSVREIQTVNTIKSIEAELLALVKHLGEVVGAEADRAAFDNDVTVLDRIAAAEPRRWLAIAKTHIQEGASALVRAVTQPV